MIFLKILMSIIGSKTQRNSTSFLKLLTGNPLFPGKNIVHQLDMMNDLLGAPFVKLLEGSVSLTCLHNAYNNCIVTFLGWTAFTECDRWGTRKLEDTWGAWGWRSLFVFHIGFHMTILSIFVFYKSCCLLSSMNGLQLKRCFTKFFYYIPYDLFGCIQLKLLFRG